MKFFPPIAAICGFVISAIVGYLVKDFFDQSIVEVEVAEMEFVQFGDPARVYETPDSVIASYNAIPTIIDEFETKMTIPTVNGIFKHSEFALEVNKETEAAIDQIRSLLSDVTEENIEEVRKEILKVASEVRSDLFEQQFKSALRRGQFVRNVRRSIEGDKFFKYRSHPDAWKDPAVARVTMGIATWDLSEIPLRADLSSREFLSALTTNVFRRMMIYLEPEMLGDVLAAMEDEIDYDVSLFESFNQSLNEWLDEIQPEKVVAGIVVNNRGKRPATIEISGMMSVSVGDKTVPFSAVLAENGGELLENVQVIEPSTTNRYKLVSVLSTETIVVSDGVTLKDLGKLDQSQILEGRVGLYARSSEGGKPIVSRSTFKMGGSIREVQQESIRSALSP